MGNWNECPSTSEHMSISRYWFEKYRAVPITITHDVLEYKVEKIITDKETAMKVAIEMYGYCLLYTSPSPRDRQKSRMPSSA